MSFVTKCDLDHPLMHFLYYGALPSEAWQDLDTRRAVQLIVDFTATRTEGCGEEMVSNIVERFLEQFSTANRNAIEAELEDIVVF